MLKVIKSILIAILIGSLGACATPLQHNTPSGKPETTIHGAVKQDVRDQITDVMINRGYTVTNANDTTIAFDRQIDNFMASAFFGSQYNVNPNARVIFSIIKMKDDVRVVADCSIITNPGSAFEKRSDLNHHPDAVQIQNILDNIRARLGKR